MTISTANTVAFERVQYLDPLSRGHDLRPVDMACRGELNHGPNQDRRDDRKAGVRAEIGVIIMPGNDSADCLAAKACIADI